MRPSRTFELSVGPDSVSNFAAKICDNFGKKPNLSQKLATLSDAFEKPSASRVGRHFNDSFEEMLLRDGSVAVRKVFDERLEEVQRQKGDFKVIIFYSRADGLERN